MPIDMLIHVTKKQPPTVLHVLEFQQRTRRKRTVGSFIDYKLVTRTSCGRMLRTGKVKWLA